MVKKYKEIFDKEIETKGYFLIINRPPLYICYKDSSSLKISKDKPDLDKDKPDTEETATVD